MKKRAKINVIIIILIIAILFIISIISSILLIKNISNKDIKNQSKNDIKDNQTIVINNTPPVYIIPPLNNTNITQNLTINNTNTTIIITNNTNSSIEINITNNTVQINKTNYTLENGILTIKFYVSGNDSYPQYSDDPKYNLQEILNKALEKKYNKTECNNCSNLI